MKSVSKLRKKLFSNIPFMTEVLVFFLPTITLSVLIVGLFTYNMEVKQVKENATYLTQNAVKQMSSMINDRLTTIFFQLDTISRSTVAQNLSYNNYPAEICNEKYNDIISMNSFMENTYQNYNEMMDSIFFANISNFKMSIYNGDRLLGEKIDINEWFRKYSNNGNGYYWINGHIDSVFQTPEQRRVISVFKNIGINGHKEGLLLFNIKESYLKNLINSIDISKNGYSLVISPDGIINSDREKPPYDIPDYKVRQILFDNKTNGSMNIKSSTGEKLLFIYKKMDVNNWIVAAVVPESDLFSNAQILKQIILSSVLFSIAIAAILSYCFAKFITAPIQSLSRQVKMYERGEIDIKFKVDGSREVQVLGNGLNSMLFKVKSQQEQKRKIELMALQSQVKPHFLYNTLASIKQLIETNNRDNAEKMCGALIQFYKIGISGGREEITLIQEIEHVRNYLLIQKMRYGDNLDFDINVEEGIYDVKILKLSIQPLVENAIYHGIKCKKDPGMIIINAREEGGCCLIDIYDDGVGIDTNTVISLNEEIKKPVKGDTETTFGLRNANQRISLHYGEQYGVQIQSIEHVCTTATLKIPLDNVKIPAERNE